MMNVFILAATSFTIAVSLMITGKNDRLQKSLAALCAAVFVSQAAVAFGNYVASDVILKFRHVGTMAIAPTALWFFGYLTRQKSFISEKIFFTFTAISACGAFAVFTPLSEMVYFETVISYYTLFALVLCYVALLWHVNVMPSGTEKRRLFYLIVACPAAWILSSADMLNSWGLNMPVVDGIVFSALLYFILLIVAYPQLLKLHDFFARSLIIIVSTITGAAIFYLVAFFLDGRPPSVEGLLLAAFLIVISFSPMKMILRKIVGYVYPESKDVFTSLYEFDEKLEREKAVMLAEMAPVVAHEIRNPLGSIKGAAQYLKSELSTPEQQELLRVIVEGTDRLNNVVSRFLDYARPYRPDIKSQNINMIIRKAIAIIAANKLAENINIIQALDNRLPGAKVDEQQFMQVVLNIALNAIESMSQGGTLTFRSCREETDAQEEVIITISDTGGGIDKKNVKDIFKPFFTTKERGVGLGLAICQKIIKEHGGSIDVQSVPSQGSTFVIRLKTSA